MRVELMGSLFSFKQQSRTLRRIKKDQVVDRADTKILQADLNAVANKVVEMQTVIGIQ